MTLTTFEPSASSFGHPRDLESVPSRRKVCPSRPMILFINEDRAYLNWVTHHRSGFVLDCRRKPGSRVAMLHRATCPDVKRSSGKKTHFTTGPHMKACSLDAEELRTWAVD